MPDRGTFRGCGVRAKAQPIFDVPLRKRRIRKTVRVRCMCHPGKGRGCAATMARGRGGRRVGRIHKKCPNIRTLGISALQQGYSWPHNLRIDLFRAFKIGETTARGVAAFARYVYCYSCVSTPLAMHIKTWMPCACAASTLFWWFRNVPWWTHHCQRRVYSEGGWAHRAPFLAAFLKMPVESCTLCVEPLATNSRAL